MHCHNDPLPPLPVREGWGSAGRMPFHKAGSAVHRVNQQPGAVWLIPMARAFVRDGVR